MSNTALPEKISSGKNTENATIGLCSEMCPQEEITLREKERLVHVLEVTESGHILVKSYSRSAANSNMAVPRLLRPYEVLLDTLHYLLLEVSNRSDIKTPILYDFLNDRLRAIRQDMTIQRLPPEQCAVLLEPMIRFYVYYGYRLCDHPLKEYDPVLNKKYLLECIKWFLGCCDILHKSVKVEDDIDTVVRNFNALDINKTRRELSCDRIMVECLYILCNLDDIHPLYRYLCLPNYVQSGTMLKLSYNIALAYMNGNYIRILKLSRRLCPLTYSALCLFLPTIQRRALQVMSHAYSSKQLTFPVEVVRRWLVFSTDEEVRSTCTYYGLKASDGISFNKANFKADVEQPQPRKHFEAKILQLKLEDILSYTV